MADDKSQLEEKVANTPQFDPDVSPNNVYNKEVAQKLGLRYDAREKVYRDTDGCPIRDEFGQYLG